ncbi:MAG TPA: sodium:proton antiporter [Chromatiales bacterium]|nr:sodium:proton antiporter [Thiotrichales bacterium]HIP67238.1 sodium:proton antiporter [Chromatiales bacterium]
MSIFDTASLLLSIAAVFAYLNYKFIKLPTTIGIMLIALVFSLILVVLSHFGIGFGEQYAEQILNNIDFNETLMHGMLSFLLFAGALHINLEALLEKKWIVGILATIGVVTTTFIVGFTSYYIFGWLGIDIPLIYCLLFGSLIAPTDPVAVMGILKTAGATKSLETKIAGESLFNDGVAVVVFLVLLGIATSGQDANASEIALLFAEEALGGAVFGFAIGWITYRMLKSVDNYQVEVLLSLALVAGGYALASQIHVSGPIAIVVAGLFIGNHGRHMAMSETTREHLDTFWELLDEILNAVLFVLIGLEVIVLSFSGNHIIAGLILALVVLLARFISVGIPINLMRLRKDFHPHVVKILTWGGLRGGISVALALSLPPSQERDIIVTITYIIVVLSIVIQGLTIKKLVEFASRKAA